MSIQSIMFMLQFKGIVMRTLNRIIDEKVILLVLAGGKPLNVDVLLAHDKWSILDIFKTLARDRVAVLNCQPLNTDDRNWLINLARDLQVKIMRLDSDFFYEDKVVDPLLEMRQFGVLDPTEFNAIVDYWLRIKGEKDNESDSQALQEISQAKTELKSLYSEDGQDDKPTS